MKEMIGISIIMAGLYIAGSMTLHGKRPKGTKVNKPEIIVDYVTGIDGKIRKRTEIRPQGYSEKMAKRLAAAAAKVRSQRWSPKKRPQRKNVGRLPGRVTTRLPSSRLGSSRLPSRRVTGSRSSVGRSSGGRGSR